VADAKSPDGALWIVERAYARQHRFAHHHSGLPARATAWTSTTMLTRSFRAPTENVLPEAHVDRRL
jgi:hypothetical protein